MVQRHLQAVDKPRTIKNKIINGDRSIRQRVLVPVVVIMLIQAVILSALVFRGPVAANLQANAIDIFQKTTENSKLNLEREVVQHWMNDINSESTLRGAIEEVLASQDKSAQDIKTDAKLNSEIIYTIMPQLIELLHRSYGNGVFIILDGPASDMGAEEEQAGVYVYDLDSSSFAVDNSDLLLYRGLPSISREYGIALDSYWQLGFTLDEDDPSTDYFYKPYNQTKDREISVDDAENYAYVTMHAPQGSVKRSGISYSIPLVLSDGTTIGIIGGDLLEDHINMMLDGSGSIGFTDDFTIVARHNKGTMEFQPVVTKGAVYERYFGTNDTILYTDTSWPDIGEVIDRQGEIWYAAMSPIEIYNNNTPFENEEWMVVRLERRDVLMDFYHAITRGLAASIVISLLIGILAAMLLSDAILRPIRKLIEELRAAAVGKGVRLKRTKISEIDELIGSIENLSKEVAVSSSRFSKILDASGVPVGVFEYMSDGNNVFCSRALTELLGGQPSEELYRYMDIKSFEKMMDALNDPIYEGEDVIYSLQTADKKRYVKMRLMNIDDGSVTGVLSDVTASMEERVKLERERNYDLLTGLYNRRAFKELVESQLKIQGDKKAALVMWDLDNLKYVNDTYGHETGDRYIRLFAEHLKHLEENGAVIERHSGDEFMAFIYKGSEEEIRNEVSLFMLAMKDMMLQVDQEYKLPLRASAGMAWYPEDAKDYDTLSRYADFAMYMAKHSVKGIVKEFDLQSYQDNSYMLSGKEELNSLLENKEVPFALQPIVARDGRVYGYEALMRPHLKNFKNIQEVLTLAKNQAKLPQFEELTWFGAMSWIHGRLEQLAPNSHFFINSIASTSLTKRHVEQLKEKYDDLFSRIVLEVTETEQLDDTYLEFKVETMRGYGGLVAVDDYGSGYNGESILLQVNPDLVKIDIDMVRNIHQDENRQMLVTNTINYCHSRGILVIAEGVEQLEELEMLMKLGVDLFQGYYLARPELEVRPLNPYVISKLKELSQK